MHAPASSSAPLVGRDHELALLRERFAAASDGHGNLVLLSGEAGIGKTTLAEAFCREAAEQGALVLVGRCYDLSETPPYGPWVDLFIRNMPHDDAPPLPEVFAHRGAVGEVASQAALFQQVVDFLAALAALAARPLVLLLDDFHWSDPASLELLRFVARALPDAPILIIATYRVDALTRHHPLYVLLPLLVRESQATRLDLQPLAADALRALVAARYDLSPEDEARLVAYLEGRAEGNPLFTGEVLRTIEESRVLRRAGEGWLLHDLSDMPVPVLLRQVIDGRVARLGEAVQALLDVASVIGQEIPLALWAAIADTTEESLLTAVEPARAGGLLGEAPDGATMRFGHALIREAVYEGVTPAQRQRLHRRIGETLAASPTPDPDAIAYHFQHGRDRRAAEWLAKAGARAQRAMAWRTAAARYEAALALMGDDDDRVQERAWLLYRLALVRRFDDEKHSLACLERAAMLAAQVDDRFLAARIQLYHGLLLCFVNNLAAGVRELQGAAAALEVLSPAERAAQPELDGSDATNDRGTVVQNLAMAGRLAEAAAIGERYIAEMPADAPTGVAGAPYADAFYGLSLVYAFRGQPDAALRTFERARQLYHAIGHFYLVTAVLHYALCDMVMPYRADRRAAREQAARALEEALAFDVAAGSTVPTRVARVPLLAIEGPWEEVPGLGRDALADGLRGTIDFLGYVAIAQGDRAVVPSLIDRWLPGGLATQAGSVRWRPATVTQRLAAQQALATGDLPTARQWLEMHDQWLMWAGAVLGAAEGEVLWAAYHRATGDPTAAEEYAQRALVHATEPHQPLALLTAHRLLGELATDAGRLDEAQTHLDAALALADGCAAPYERALTLLALAALRAATDQRDAAGILLEEAGTILSALGAPQALARTDALAARISAAPAMRPVYPAGLSAREVEVLRLLAAGQSNRQIADALFLSEHTVRAHVRNILTKTGTDNRAAATAFAFQNALA